MITRREEAKLIHLLNYLKVNGFQYEVHSYHCEFFSHLTVLVKNPAKRTSKRHEYDVRSLTHYLKHFGYEYRTGVRFKDFKEDGRLTDDEGRNFDIKEGYRVTIYDK